MKALFCIIISLILLGSMFIGCSDQIVNSNESSSSEGSLLLKKPNKPPKPPKTPSATPLPALNMNDQYIAGISDGKVYIWDGDNLTYMWSTSIDAFMINGIGIGNFINDGNKQLLVARRIKVGKGKKNSVESEELLIFTEGDIEPSKTITLRIREDSNDALWDMKIANVDNDDDLEIILAFRDKLEIWEYDGTTISPTATFDFSTPLEFPWGIDIGDFNGNGVTNEIIVSFSGNFWRRYEYDEYDGISSISKIEESTKYNEYGSLNCVKIADLDGIKVLGGSSVGKILVWESSNQIIASDQVIPDYFAWAVDVGELDGNVDNGKEIIGVSSNSNRLHLFHYDDGTLIYEDKVITALSNSLNDVIISGEYPNNKIIVATSNGLEVFNNVNNVYETFLVDDVGMLENLIFE